MRETSEEEGDHLLCEMIIATHNRVFIMDINTKGFELYESETPFATGSGQPYWLASYKTLEFLNGGKLQGTKKQQLMAKMQYAMQVTADLVTHVDDNVDFIIGGGVV